MAAEFAAPSRKLAYASPVLLDDPGRSVIKRLKTMLPDEERSFDSLLKPKRYSIPALKACLPANLEIESGNCVSRMGDWMRAMELLATAWLPSSAYPVTFNVGNAAGLTPV